MEAMLPGIRFYAFLKLMTITMPGRTGIAWREVNRSHYHENTPKRRTQRPSGVLNCNAGVVKTPGFDALKSNQTSGMTMARMM